MTLLARVSGRQSHELRELLRMVLAAEMLAPSRCLWIVSRELRDVALFENGGGEFQGLEPVLPRRTIRLSDVVRVLLDRGATVVLATGEGAGQRQVPDALRLLPRGSDGPDERFVFRHVDGLEGRGVVADRWALTGSLNLTPEGLRSPAEMFDRVTDAADVQGLRLSFHEAFGGLL